jgi:hypothetical protein
MQLLLRVLIVCTSLVYTTAAQALACVPMPTLENPAAMVCTPEPPPAAALDTTAPTIVSIVPSTAQTALPYTVTVVFSEDVADFEVADIENLAPESISVTNMSASDARTYTFTVTGADGSHRIHVRTESVHDAAGNALLSPEGTGYEAVVVYDTTAPVVSVTNAPIHGGAMHTPAHFDITSDDTAASYECAFIPGNTLGDAVFIPCNPLEGESVATFSPTLEADGVYTFAVRAVDEVGNISTPNSTEGTLITFTYDTTLPIFSVATPVPVVTPTVNPSFTVTVNEQTTLEFYGPCRSGAPTSIGSGTHVITFSPLPPGTYSQREEGESSVTLVSVPSEFMPFPEKSRYLCFFSVTDAAGNALFHTISTFTIAESSIVVETPATGGGNGPISVVTGTPTFTGGTPVVIESSTVQPGNGGRVIIGQNSIVPSISPIEITSPVFVATGGTAPVQTSTVTVVNSQPVISQQPRRVAIRTTTRRTRPASQPSQQGSTTVPAPAPENQTASAASATDGFWRYILSFFGY